MQLSIIIINYHSEDLIRDCLHSIGEHNPLLLYEIIVASNGADPEKKHGLLNRFPEVKWIEMGYNAGFARANNAGLRKAKGDLLLLLNPDTLAIDDSIDRCCQQFPNSPYAACGVQLLNEDGSPQPSGSFFVKGGLNHLLPIPYWGNVVRWLGYRTKSRVPSLLEAKEVEEVDWINGAFLMVKRSTLEQSGYLDEDFFLYSEEIEWCSRLKKVGPLCIFGNLKMIHLQGVTVNKDRQSTEKGYQDVYTVKGLQLMVSHLVRVRKQYGFGWFLFLLLNYTWGVLFFAVCSTVRSLVTFSNPKGEWQRLAAYTRNVAMLWRLFPTIARNKPHYYKMF